MVKRRIFLIFMVLILMLNMSVLVSAAPAVPEVGRELFEVNAIGKQALEYSPLEFDDYYLYSFNSTYLGSVADFGTYSWHVGHTADFSFSYYYYTDLRQVTVRSADDFDFDVPLFSPSARDVAGFAHGLKYEVKSGNLVDLFPDKYVYLSMDYDFSDDVVDTMRIVPFLWLDGSFGDESSMMRFFPNNYNGSISVKMDFKTYADASTIIVGWVYFDSENKLIQPQNTFEKVKVTNVSVTDKIPWEPFENLLPALADTTTWFWQRFDSLVTMISTVDLLLWMVVFAILAGVIYLLLRVLRKFKLNGRR